MKTFYIANRIEKERIIKGDWSLKITLDKK